jgi:UDP-N-acetylmuramate--alanine ligase
VIEADEYDGMFLGLEPKVAVVTNVEWDHVDCYPTPESHREAFVKFLGKVRAGGTVIIFSEDEGARKVKRSLSKDDVRQVDYGLQQGQWKTADVHIGADGASFRLVYPGGEQEIRLALTGRHNVANSVAAMAAAYYSEGVPPSVSGMILADFHGTERRFQVKGEAGGVIVVDDYAHHPTEIRATIRMAKERFPGRELWAVFQPHTFTRTRAMLEDFARSFAEAEHVLITDIYPAREKDDLGVHSNQIVEKAEHPDMSYSGDIDSTVAKVMERIEPGSVLLTLGAGDGYLVGEKVLEKLRQRENSGS